MLTSIPTRGGRILLSALVTLLIQTQPAHAHDRDHHSEHGRTRPGTAHLDDRYNNDHQRNKTVIYRTRAPQYNYVHIAIDNDQRNLAGYYLARSYRQDCPPGLNRKYGCIPPGHGRRYIIGRPLPEYVIWRRVPDHVLYHLPPAPRGTVYGYADRDLVLMVEATKQVLDAVVLLSSSR